MTREEFDVLIYQFESTTSYCSTMHHSLQVDKGKFNAYPKLQEAGKDIVPFLIDDVRDGTGHWTHFSLLFESLKDEGISDCIADADRGRLGNIRDNILRWYDNKYNNIPTPDVFELGLDGMLYFDFHAYYKNTQYIGKAIMQNNRRVQFEVEGIENMWDKEHEELRNFLEKQFESTKEYKVFLPRLDYRIVYEPQLFIEYKENPGMSSPGKFIQVARRTYSEQRDEIVFYDNKDKEILFGVDRKKLMKICMQYDKDYTYHPNLQSKMDDKEKEVEEIEDKL